AIRVTPRVPRPPAQALQPPPVHPSTSPRAAATPVPRDRPPSSTTGGTRSARSPAASPTSDPTPAPAPGACAPASVLRPSSLPPRLPPRVRSTRSPDRLGAPQAGHSSSLHDRRHEIQPSAILFHGRPRG